MVAWAVTVEAIGTRTRTATAKTGMVALAMTVATGTDMAALRDMIGREAEATVVSATGTATLT